MRYVGVALKTHTLTKPSQRKKVYAPLDAVLVAAVQGRLDQGAKLL